MQSTGPGRLPYTGVPDVEPAAAPPEDYLRPQTNPLQFGAGVGEAEQRLGGQLEETGTFYASVAATQNANQLLDFSQKKLFGDPSDPNEPGAMNLKGPDAMRAVADVTEQIRQKREDLMAGLPAIGQQEFLRQTFSMDRYMLAQAATHAREQQNVWAAGQASDQQQIALRQITEGVTAGNMGMVDSGRQAVISSTVAQDQARYGQLTPEMYQAAVERGTGVAAENEVRALMRVDPTKAPAYLDANAPFLTGDTYARLKSEVDHFSNKAEDDALVHSIVSGHGGSPGVSAGGPISDPRGVVPLIRQTAQKYGIDPETAVAVARSEGLAQFTGDGGTSFGAFQLHKAPGAMGADFQRDTGLDPADPKNEPAAIDYALRQASQGGWGPFHGAARSGIADDAGIGGVPGRASAGVTQQGVIAPPMQQPVPNFPTHEDLIARIPNGLSDERYDRVYAGVTRQYNQMVQAVSADRAQVLAQVKGGQAMLADGRDFTIDEPKIRSLFPKDTADEMISGLQDARTIGQQVTAVRGMPLSDILNQQAANRAVLANSTGDGYARQARLSAAFDKAADAHIKALADDPAGYVEKSNPQIAAARQAIGAETPQQRAVLAGSGQPTAAESYAAKMLGEQERLQVPQDEQHVLSNLGAQQTAAGIAANPEQAPAQLKAMQQQWGSAWPSVWKDIATVGGLPTAYQMVGSLDNEADGALLARALGSANKEGVNKPIEELLDRGQTGSSAPSHAIRIAVSGDDHVRDYALSMHNSGASDPQIESLVSSITLLAQAKALYGGVDNPAQAAQQAIDSAIGKWQIMPNGGARIPTANADAITDTAHETVLGLTLPMLQPPAQYAQPNRPPGSTTADDWLRQLKAAPNWITMGNSIVLKGNDGRLVRRANGSFVEVPFTATAPPRVGATPAAEQPALAPTP